MRSKSPQKRGRQKVVPLPTYRIENEYNPEAMPQYFQVSVHVLEGRKLVWTNPHLSSSYVIVVLDKKKHRTSIRRNMPEPQYRENFVFELYTTVQELKQQFLWLAVMEPRCCGPPRLLGEASIELGLIWSQPYHQVLHKWAQLYLPRDRTAGPVGFLQVDVCIFFRAEELTAMPIAGDNKLEDNLLHYNAQQQRAMYVITVYGAFGLPNSSQCQSDKRLGKPPNTFVKVSFCELGAKTGVVRRKTNPMYNVQISIVEMFPNMCQAIGFEVCSADGCFNRVLSCTQLKLDQISYDGENGFLPTFGPSMIPMYGTTTGGSLNVTGDEGPYYRGALVVAVNTKVPYYQEGFRNITVEPIPSIKFKNIWVYEDFCIFCPIFEVSMLDTKVSGKFCGIAITVGEIPSDDSNSEESYKLHYTGVLEVLKSQHSYGYIDFCNSYPVLQLATRLPDFRYRMYRNNMILGIYNKLEQSLKKIERKLANYVTSNLSDLEDQLIKTMDDTVGSIMKFIDIVQSTLGPNDNDTVTQYTTDLDQKQIKLQIEEIEKLQLHIIQINKIYETTANTHIQKSRNRSCSKKKFKTLLAEAKSVAFHLGGLINRDLEGWPDIVVWLLNNGSRVAFTKISTADVIHSVIPEQSGINCGQIKTVYLKPLKCPKHVNSSAMACFCVVGKVELLVWMGLHRHRTEFQSFLHTGYKLKVKETCMYIKTNATMVEFKAFIYNAKLFSGSDGTNSMNFFVRINIINSQNDTEMCNTLMPVWNQVIKINRIIFMPLERLLCNPPIVLVQVNSNDASGKTELIGSVEIRPSVNDTNYCDCSPELQLFDLFRGMEFAGQILMSVQLLQISEKLMKNTIYTPVEDVYVTNTSNDMNNLICDVVEPLPKDLLLVPTSYRVDVYWWGLRGVNITKKPCVIMEIENLTLKSEIIADKKPNCNFPNGRTSQMFEAYLNETYCPQLSIKLFDSSSFGRSLYLGTNVVKNPNKYRIEWLPEEEREDLLKNVSILSSEFVQVNQKLFIKKSSQFIREDSYSSKSSMSSIRSKTRLKKWFNLFSNREPDEEKYTLLPAFTKKTENNSVSVTTSTTQKDWWLRYLRSQKDYDYEDNLINTAEKLVIYETELEVQPEFSKFKDWCSTLKLYNGKKTNIPDKDEKLYCGVLKAGLAIYKWPPPANTTPITPSGVNLNRGFFDDYPSNAPAKFLVRVYIVKGIDLKIKECTGKSDPYVVLNCGNNYINDRDRYVPDSVNPIFGRMYEFRCSLPEDYLLEVSLYDFVTNTADKLIGTTTIDIENRIYTKHRARVGLSSEYSFNEPLKWRDCVKPSAILEELCSRNHLPPPGYINSSTLIVNDVEYRNSERDRSFTSAAQRKEKLCLNILNKWHTLPVCGYHLVPEHIETRTLYNPDKPGSVQGKIQLWVDIFPVEPMLYVPPPVNIAARRAEDYELRLTVYASRVTMDYLDNYGNRNSDFYVKAWIGAADQYQNTDVHYSCLRGEANFNWRMIFHFRYQHDVRKLVSKEKSPFIRCEDNVPPILNIQLVDNEESGPDEYLGSVLLNLSNMPLGAKQEQECNLKAVTNSKKVNFFSTKSMRSWWPLRTIDSSGCLKLVGKIDLELTLLSQEQANQMAVGMGRDPPRPLPQPMRPVIHSDGCSHKKKSVKPRGCVRIFFLAFFVCSLFFVFFLAVLYFQVPNIILDYLNMI